MPFFRNSSIPDSAAPGKSTPSSPTTQGISRGLALFFGFGLSMIAWLAIYGPYFDSRLPAVGHDFLLTAPALFDGALFFWKNGPFFLPWFTPGFCGGQPLLADPQSMFLSPLQWFAFGLPPMAATGLYAFLCAAAAYWGFWLMAKRAFLFNPWAASLVGVFGALHGFMPHRLITGEVGFGSYALFGFIVALALDRKEHFWRLFGRLQTQGQPTLVAPSFAATRFGQWMARGRHLDAKAWLLGFFGAEFILWGGLGLAPILALSLLALFFTQRALGLGGPLRALSGRWAKAALWFVALVAFQVSASSAVLSHFPRLSPSWPGFPSLHEAFFSYALALVQSGEAQALQFNTALVDSQWAVFPMEWAQNFGWSPWLVAGLCFAALALRAAIQRRRNSKTPPVCPCGLSLAPSPAPRLLQASRLACALLAGMVLILPGLLLWHEPHWVQGIKSFPFFASSTWPFRWILIAAAPTALFLAWPIGRVLEWAEERFSSVAPLTAFVALTVFLWAMSAQESRDFYMDRDVGYQGAAAIESAWGKARANPSQFDVVAVGPTLPQLMAHREYANAERNNLVAIGESAKVCYNPLFGYRAESSPAKNLQLSSIFGAPTLLGAPAPASAVATPTLSLGASTQATRPTNDINLLNPACLAWPDANACKPGDQFARQDKKNAQAFAARLPFSYAKSLRQRASEWVSAVAWILWLGLGLVVFARRFPSWSKGAPVLWSRIHHAFTVDLSKDKTVAAGPVNPDRAPISSPAKPGDAKTASLDPDAPRMARPKTILLGLLCAAAFGSILAFLAVYGSSGNALLWDDSSIFSFPGYARNAPLWPALSQGFSLNPELYWRPIGLATLLIPSHLGLSLVGQQMVREGLWVFTALLAAIAGSLALVLRERVFHRLPAPAQGRKRSTLVAGSIFGSGLFVSAFWSLGSVNAEAAQWLSGRFDLLCAFFLALWFSGAFFIAAHPRKPTFAASSPREAEAAARASGAKRAQTLASLSFFWAFACAVGAFWSKDFAPGFFLGALPFSLWIGRLETQRLLSLFASSMSPASVLGSGRWARLKLAWRAYSGASGLLAGGVLAAIARQCVVGTHAMVQTQSLSERVSTSAASAVRYVFELLNWPGIGISRPVIYWMPSSTWPLALAIAFWIVVAGAALWTLLLSVRSKSPTASLAWGALGGALFFGAMLVLGGLSASSTVSERYLSAPLFVLGLAIGPWLIDKLSALASPSEAAVGGVAVKQGSPDSTRRLVRLLVVLSLGLFSLLGLWQTKQNQLYFADPESFWEHAASMPDAPMEAKSNYLAQLTNNNHPEAAVAYGEKLLANRQPSSELIRPATNLGVAYANTDQVAKALALEQRYAAAGFAGVAMQSNIASHQLLLGHCDEAIEALQKALIMRTTIDGPDIAMLRASGRPRLLAMYAVCRPQEYEAQKQAYMASQRFTDSDLTNMGMPLYIKSAREALDQAHKKGVAGGEK